VNFLEEAVRRWKDKASSRPRIQRSRLERHVLDNDRPLSTTERLHIAADVYHWSNRNPIALVQSYYLAVRRYEATIRELEGRLEALGSTGKQA